MAHGQEGALAEAAEDTDRTLGHQEHCCHQAEGSDSALPLSAGEAPSQKLCAVLGSPMREMKLLERVQ